MKRLLLITITLAFGACVTPAYAFDFGTGQAPHILGANLPQCTASTERDYIVIDAVSGSSCAGGAPTQYSDINYCFCDQNTLEWRVFASTFWVKTPQADSVFGRTGDVVAQVGDYTVGQVLGAAASSSLASTSAGQGASLIGVRDAAGNFVGADVEAVLEELKTIIDGVAGGSGHGDGTNAPDGQAITGVDANGNAQGAFDVATQAELDAVEADLVSPRAGGPNAVGGLVDWSELVNVPAGFADGTDDGGGAAHGDGTNCPAGQYPLGVDENGNAQGCTPDADTNATNLGTNVGASDVTVTSDTGSDAVIPAATSTTAGALTGADKLALDLSSARVELANPAEPLTTTYGIAEAVTRCGVGISSPLSQGCVVLVPGGDFSISSTITVGGDTLATAKEGVWLVGVSSGAVNSVDGATAGTTIRWAGAAGQPMIDLRGCSLCGVEGMTLDGEGIAANGIRLVSQGVPSRKPTLRNVHIRNATGYGIDLPSSAPGQVDFLTLQNVEVRDSGGCYRQQNAQSVGNRGLSLDCSRMAETASRYISLEAGEFEFSHGFLGIHDVPTGGLDGVYVAPTAIARISDNRFEFGISYEEVFAGGAGPLNVIHFAGGDGIVDTQSIVANEWNMQVEGGHDIACLRVDRRGWLNVSGNSLLTTYVDGPAWDPPADCTVELAQSGASGAPLYVNAFANANRLSGSSDAAQAWPWVITGEKVELLELNAPDVGASDANRAALIRASDDLAIVLDFDEAANPDDGTLAVRNGAGVSILSLDEAGNLTIGGELTAGVSTAGEDYAMVGSRMTRETLNRMMALPRFTGLHPSISWTDVYVDPYLGDDANPGTQGAPIKTLGRTKQLATVGSRFVIANGSGPRVFSNMTFGYTPGSGTCLRHEAVTYGAAQSAEILDIDTASTTVVLRTAPGDTPAAVTDELTGATSGCTITLATWEPSIWDGSTFVCDLNPTATCTPNGTTCLRGGACLADCASGQECVGAGNARVNLSAVPSTYDGRVVVLWEPEAEGVDWFIDGDRQGLSWATGNTTEDDVDDGGLFIAGWQSASATTYGALGVVHAVATNVADDVFSTHGEGAVRTLHSVAVGVENGAGNANNNAFTSHNGTLGRGGIVAVGAAASSLPHDATGGGPVVPTGDSHIVLLGTDRIDVDLSDYSTTGTRAPVEGAGGDAIVIGHRLGCVNWAGTSSGCHAFSMSASAGTSQVGIADADLKTDHDLGGALLSTVGVLLGATGTANIDAVVASTNLDAGIDLRVQAVPTDSVTLKTRGVAFSSAGSSYITTISPTAANVTADIQGVYDETGQNRWSFDGVLASTLAAARNNAPRSWSLHLERSRELAHADLTSGNRIDCGGTPGCVRALSEAIEIPFPVTVYDYLPVPITGYLVEPREDFGVRRP